jgi:hypothetical protein
VGLHFAAYILQRHTASQVIRPFRSLPHNEGSQCPWVSAQSQKLFDQFLFAHPVPFCLEAAARLPKGARVALVASPAVGGILFGFAVAAALDVPLM